MLNVSNVFVSYCVGSYTEIETCLNRGTTQNGYKNLCTTCSGTTILPDNYWPNVLNEAICHSTDPTCMNANGIGKIIDRGYYMVRDQRD